MSIRKAVFPAAGFGTRFLPATKASPKEMLPIVDKPMIQYVVEEAVSSGLEQIIMITGRGKRAIEDHFDMAYELEHALEEQHKDDLLQQVRTISEMLEFCYVRQKNPRGLGHAVLCASNVVGDEFFAVLLGDDIIYSDVPCLKQLMDIHEKYGCSLIAVEEVEKEHISKYGVITPKKVADGVYEIHDVVEKPDPSKAPSNLAIIGRYILSPSIFGILKKVKPDGNGEIQLTDGLRGLLKHEKVYGVKYRGKRFDAGSKIGFLKATVEFALQRSDLKDEFVQYLKELLVSNNVITVDS